MFSIKRRAILCPYSVQPIFECLERGKAGRSKRVSDFLLQIGLISMCEHYYHNLAFWHKNSQRCREDYVLGLSNKEREESCSVRERERILLACRLSAGVSVIFLAGWFSCWKNLDQSVKNVNTSESLATVENQFPPNPCAQEAQPGVAFCRSCGGRPRRGWGLTQLDLGLGPGSGFHSKQQQDPGSTTRFRLHRGRETIQKIVLGSR